MKVLVILPSLYDTSPGSRFRIEQWALYLERQGYRFTFVPFETSALHRAIYQPGQYLKKTALLLEAIVRRLGILSLVKRHDVVFLYEEAARLGPPVLEWLIRQTRTPIVYDFCDPIWIPYVSPVNKYFSYLKCFGKCAQICRMSAQVIVGNRFLADYARRYNANVAVIPITIDTEQYRPTPAKPRTANQVTIGWSGSVTTARHLELLSPVLGRLTRQASFQLKVVGTRRPRLDGIPFSYSPWTKDTEVAEIQSFDIGLMPLPDDKWTRLRTQLKVRQYMSLGMPAVASPVGLIPELIQDGVNGFLAASDEEWAEKLCRLIKDPSLRGAVGREGRRTIEESCSARAWVPRVKAVLEAAAGRPAGNGRGR
jgi:glycosyltransferase involved in cell wall biosynthesis